MFGFNTLCGAPFCSSGGTDLDELIQAISFSQTAIPILQLNTSSVLTLAQVLTAQSISQIPVDDSIVFGQGFTLNHSQVAEILQSLVFSANANYYDQLLIEQALSFVQTNNIAFGLSATQSFTLTQQANINNVLSNVSNQSLSFIHNGILNFIYNLALCDCLTFDQKVGEWIAVSVTQSLVFVLTEILGVEQTLVFLDSIDTNFDFYTCCGDIYGVPDRKEDDDVVFVQSVTVGGVYRQNISQSMTLLSTGLWRT